jgi:outer membrane protein insertion porin family
MKKLIACKLILFMLIFVILTGNFLSAQEEKISIVDVEIKGNKIISSSIIQGKIKTKAGDEFSQEILNQDIKRLYATGYFTDVRLEIVNLEDGIKERR